MPQLVRDSVGRHRAGSVEQEEREQDALPRASDRYWAPVANHLDRTEHPKLDHALSEPGCAAVCMERW